MDALLGRLSPNEAISICITTEHFASYSMLVDKYSSSVALVTLAPFDFPFFIKRAWEIIKPDLIISVHQTALFELWHYASAKKVPVTLINASLSTLEFRILGALPIFTRYLVAPFERIYVRSLRDQERFLRLGVLKDNLIIGGNLKSDRWFRHPCNTPAHPSNPLSQRRIRSKATYSHRYLDMAGRGKDLVARYEEYAPARKRRAADPGAKIS